MFDKDFIEKLGKRLSDAVPSSLHTIKNDLERNFKAVLQSAFAKLDLVTREEFDAQTKVLAKTRSKLDALERQITELEKLKTATRQSTGKRSQSTNNSLKH